MRLANATVYFNFIVKLAQGLCSDGDDTRTQVLPGHRENAY